MATDFAARTQQILDDAARAAGHSDYGDDPAFRDNLQFFLEQLDAEGRLTPEGAAATEGQISLLLQSRLHVVANWKAWPAYRDVEIRRPLIITGIVRSGTTALHRLMTVDPQFLGVPHWLVRAPRPLPPQSEWAGDPLYQSAKAALDHMISLAPEMLNDHMMTADAVEESIFLLAPTFANNMFPCQWTIPAYDAWYRNLGEGPQYRFLADILRLIGLNDQGRPWLMKNPTDLHAIKDVFDVFPDVRIIHTHRDPVQAIPSIANLLMSVRRMFEGANADPAQVLSREATFWAEALDRADAFKANHADRFVDVEFGHFVKNQMAEVERIYAELGLTLDGKVADDMRQWLDENPRRPGNIQRHTAEDFGVDTAWVEQLYDRYRRSRGYA